MPLFDTNIFDPEIFDTLPYLRELRPGYFMPTFFPLGYWRDNFWVEYGLAAPAQTSSRLRQIIAKLETVQDYGITSPSVDEPGMDNPFCTLRKIIAKMEQQ